MENFHSLVDDIVAKRLEAASYPILVFLESVRGCPFSCVMCDFHDTKTEEMSPRLLNKISPLFKYLDTLCIHGNGEPLLGKNLDFFIASAVENDFRLGMNTTGILLKPSLSEKLLQAKLDIWFSVHAGEKDTYRRIMGGDLDRAAENIAYLVERNSTIGSGKNRLGLSYIVMKENINEIENFLYLASKIGVRRVRFQELMPKAHIIKGEYRNKNDFTFDFFEQHNLRILKLFKERLPKIRDLAQKLGIETSSEFVEHKAKRFRSVKEKANIYSRRRIFPLLKRKGQCLAPWAGEVTIELNGRVTLCCSSDTVLGNLNTESFEKIWNSARIKAVRKKFRDGYFPHACGYCPGRGFDNYSNSLHREFKEYKQ